MSQIIKQLCNKYYNTPIDLLRKEQTKYSFFTPKILLKTIYIVRLKSINYGVKLCGFEFQPYLLFNLEAQPEL